EPQQSRFRDLFAEMHAQKTKEAKIYKALDKMEACIQHNESPLDTWLPLEYELNQTYGVENAKCDPKLESLRALVTEDTIAKLEKDE
ncbi:MAG: HD domain-containing protein, partial [Anaerotignum sp.]|nr:HD domain-containing protein [Anaerotignum sp.]